MFAASELNLLAARNLMALSLGLHIILAALGVGFPLITLIAHRRGLRNGDPDALLLARRWAKVMAVLFAVGAVSGTILSFEMGILWPGLMEPFGDVIGLPFALEGTAFFAEAIFIAIYLYGWKRLSAKVHYLTLYPVVISGIGGTFFVVSVNAWMNAPAGFAIATNGATIEVDPWRAMFNGALETQFLHMLLAAYMVSGFLVAGAYAAGWLRGRRTRIQRLGFVIPFMLAALATPLQILVGDAAARRLVSDQPAKFAAMELVTETEAGSAFTVGGVLIDGEKRFAIEIPRLGALLGTRSFDGTLPALDQVPDDQVPPVNIVHWSFQIMVAIGTGLLALVLVFAWVGWRRRRLPESIWFWRAAAISGVAAVIAMEAGWVTTEVGRQPWIVWQLVRTRDAVTEASGIWFWFVAIAAVYTLMGIATIVVLRMLARRFDRGDDVPAPYGPGERAA